jgi:hypothetical protein
MALTLSHALRRVKSELQLLVPDRQIERICRDCGHHWRKRLLEPAITVHLMLLQLLATVALSALPAVAHVSVTGEAIRKAKLRLPRKLFYKLVQRVCPKDPISTSLWHGLIVLIADGVSFMTQDTPELCGKYGKSSNGRRPSYSRPTPKLLAMLDLSGGFIRRVIALPWARQERTCLSRLFDACPKGSLLLGDRGLVSHAHLAMMLQRGIHGCFRLPRWLATRGRGTDLRRSRKRLGKQDLLVTWKRNHWGKTRQATWMSKRRWFELPKQLTLRQIAFRITRRGFRTHWAWIITTLTDAQAYPAQELVELYSKRWRIEVCFRDLKQTLGFKQLQGKKLDSVRREILAMVILYNLVRRVILRSARLQKVPPDRISFKAAMLWLLWNGSTAALAELQVNPLRPQRPTQPRMVKQRQRKYAQIKQNRSNLLRPPAEVKL